ncbi:MAG: NUDIX domain-containing protein [Methanobrevibacter sp.]|jgi:8-oxo-dGTP diphosphatase|nr:NUDIX domain-containing protein [Candidatus Methanoflexus mossambicus]
MQLPYGLTVRGILKKENKILLLKRVENSKTNPKCWELPGGKVDPGEFFDDALIREFMEETNLKIEIGDFVYALQDNYPHKRTVVLIFIVEIIKKPTSISNNESISKKIEKEIKEDILISDEHSDYKWVDMKELRNLKLSSWFNVFLKSKCEYDWK